MNRLKKWIEELNLEQHVEGGFFRRVFTCKKNMSELELPNHSGARPHLTTIYYALPAKGISKLHRLKSDEIWFFHDGASLTIHKISPEGIYTAEKLGKNLSEGEKPQVPIEAGFWFGATAQESPVLVSCAVAPGFSFEDFELADSDKMQKQYPNLKEIIKFLS